MIAIGRLKIQPQNSKEHAADHISKARTSDIGV